MATEMMMVTLAASQVRSFESSVQTDANLTDPRYF